MNWRPEIQSLRTHLLLLLCGVVGSSDPGCACQQANSPCNETVQCLRTELCQAGRCRTICNVSSECNSGESCRNGICMPAVRLCEVDSDCFDIERCVEHLCRLRCSSAADCAAGELCLGDACVPARDASMADDGGLPDRASDGATDDRATVDVTAPDQTSADAPRDAATVIDASDAAGAVDAGGADAAPVASCLGRADFMLCRDPMGQPSDHAICVDEQCVVPGCGTASCNTPGPHFKLADTDQRTCYNGGGDLDCTTIPGGETCSATAYCGQDAQYGWDVQHAASERFERLLTGNEMYVVRDNVTRLMWQGCQYLRSGINCGSGNGQQLTWSNAVAACDGLTWGGHDDWYLPDSYELQSIVDYDLNGPAIDGALFPGTDTVNYWTSTTIAGVETDAWVVDFTHGQIAQLAKSTTKNFRCVRRDGIEPRPAQRWTIELVGGERVASDAVAGLAWQGCLSGVSGEPCNVGTVQLLTWVQALAACETLVWGGRSDWRLPNVKELRSINDFRLSSPALATAIFPNPLPGSTAFSWTSTTNRSNKGQAWQCGANLGNTSSAAKTVTNAVRCVRDLP